MSAGHDTTFEGANTNRITFTVCDETDHLGVAFDSKEASVNLCCFTREQINALRFMLKRARAAGE